MNCVTILIADDHLPTLQLLARVLCDEGYTVVSAQDGSQALHLLSAHAPHLVISDVHMPFLDEFGVCREVRAHPQMSGLPVFLCTASPFSELDHTLASQLGVAGLFLKPVRIDELLQSVEGAVSPRRSEDAEV